MAGRQRACPPGHGKLRSTMAPGGSPSGLAAFAGIEAEALWLRPLGLLRGAAAQAMIASGDAVPLAGGTLGFTLVEALALRDGTLLSAAATIAALRRWAAGQGVAVAERVAAQLA